MPRRPSRRSWINSTGTLDSIVLGVSRVRFTVDSELLADSTIYPNCAVTWLRTSTHAPYWQRSATHTLVQTLL